MGYCEFRAWGNCRFPLSTIKLEFKYFQSVSLTGFDLLPCFNRFGNLLRHTFSRSHGTIYHSGLTSDVGCFACEVQLVPNRLADRSTIRNFGTSESVGIAALNVIGL